jgi:limonene-1,2-epoxide hydrolase
MNTVSTYSEKVVMAFINALNDEDFTTAREQLADGMRFDGVMGSRDSADAYISDMTRMKFKYNIKKLFADENDVCLLYDINMGAVTIFTCGWYHVEDGKISSLKVVFDPRPLLEKKG